MKFLKLVVAIVGISFAVDAWAAPVLNIIVKGNERVEEETVFSYLGFEVGADYDPFITNKAIKDLYATGLFAHVEVDWNGELITISVQENPLVNKIAFEGNEEIVDSRLESFVGLHPRAVYTPGKVQADVRELKAAYRQSGLFLAEVQPQIIKREQNRVDVIYKITEGQETEVQNIRFVGNKRFSDNELKAQVRTRESRWWRILSSTDVYDPALIDVDKELLRRYYIKHGFADFKVTSAVAELSRDKKRFFITFSISEGEIYDFGKVDVAVHATEEDLTAESLQESVSIDEGDRYDGSRIDVNIDNITDALGSRGYAFLDVSPELTKDEANRTVDITFNVTPGPRVYVNRINIKGNDRTRDNVIRREMRFAEGDAFSSNKLKRSRDRLNYLGYFENVDVQPSETEYPDKIDLDVNVAEQSTGEFNVGAGLSSYEGVLANADIRERNFMGRGQDASLRFALSSKRQDFRFSFTEPYFLDQELSAGIDLFNESRDYQSESSYDLNRQGGTLGFGFPVDEFTKNSFRVGFKETEITDVDADASKFVKREDDKRASLSVGNTYSIDTRDSFLTPTHGHRIAVSTDYSGFGTETEYVRATLNASWHKEVKPGWVLSLAGRAGAVSDFGGDKELPLYEHFQARSGMVRGFASGGFGPRDRTNDDALGGKFMVGNNIDLTFPIPGLEEMGISGVMFLDGGMITEFEDDADVQDSRLYRIGAGTGVFWRSPVGPLRFEFGLPVLKSEEDRTEIFSFSLGTRF